MRAAKALDLNAQAAFAHFTLGKILIAERKPQQALAEIEKEPSDWAKLTGLALVYHAPGREQNSNAALADLVTKYDAGGAYQIAQVYAYRGKSNKSFEWLERAYKQRDAGLPDIKTDPLLKNLRNDPRYTEFLKKMRLPR